MNGLVRSTTLIGWLLCAGCVQTTYYDWGQYQDLLYTMYLEPGNATADHQIQVLTRQVGETTARGRRVPPGLHAHLGFLHFQQGDGASAVEHFTAEKNLFPESTEFIDGILRRMRKGAAR